MDESKQRSKNLYEVTPVETKLEGGFPDIVVIQKQTGQVALSELKNINHSDNNLKLRKNQPLFLRRWAALCPGVTRAWVVARICHEKVPSGIYMWYATPSYEWVTMIKGPLVESVKHTTVFFPEERSMPWNKILENLFPSKIS